MDKVYSCYHFGLTHSVHLDLVFFTRLLLILLLCTKAVISQVKPRLLLNKHRLWLMNIFFSAFLGQGSRKGDSFVPDLLSCNSELS